MGVIKDLTGQKFGRLTSIKKAGKNNYRIVLWECQCDCGNLIVVRSTSLRNNHTKSCGCLHLEIIIKNKTTHGYGRKGYSPDEYNSWTGMKNRCYNSKSKGYKNYGGRGIKVCPRWLNNFGDFFKDMGKKPNKLHSIDRIDINGNYEPTNCRWATRYEQSRNRQGNRWFEHRGEKYILQDWATILNIKEQCLSGYLKNHTFEEAYEHYVE